MAMAHETLEALEARYRGPLVRFFSKKLGSGRADAEDLTQDVFVRLLRERIEAAKNMDSLVFTIAINILRDHQRRKSVRNAHFASQNLSLLFEPIEDVEPERVLVGKEALAEAIEALETLPLRTRRMFMLFRFEKMKQYEIAAVFGLSTSMVEKEIAKAVHVLTAAARGDGQCR